MQLRFLHSYSCGIYVTTARPLSYFFYTEHSIKNSFCSQGRPKTSHLAAYFIQTSSKCKAGEQQSDQNFSFTFLPEFLLPLLLKTGLPFS